MNPTNPRHIPACPRCEYDQRGEVTTWSSRCPMRGRCSECGYEFAWSEVYGVLNEWGSELDWYAEHSKGWVDLVVRTPRTLLRLLFPIWFFRSVNHRRAIRLGMLMRWMIVVTLMMHLVVSIAGVIANKLGGPWSRVGYNGYWVESFLDTLCNTFSGLLFPYAAIMRSYDGVELRFPYMYYDENLMVYSQLSLVAVGVVLSWTVLMGVVFLLRWRGGYDRRHELGLFGRVILLSLLPILVYFQILRIGFSFYVSIDGVYDTNWVPILFLVLLVLLIFWQQVLWTHAVRTIWEIKRSWVINIGGCFGSFIGGVIFAGWVLT